MFLDPVSLSALSGAAGGAAGKFVEKTVSLGHQWIADYFKDHGKDVQKKAESNADNFLTELAAITKAIQETGKDDPISSKLVTDSFKDPDFSAVLQKSIIAAARTSSEDTHKILARLIGERLLSATSTPIALASELAVDAMSALDSTQLYFLALTELVSDIRPQNMPKNTTIELINDIASKWWGENLQPLLKHLGDLKEFDILHLLGANCLMMETIIGRDLHQILKAGFGEWDTEKFLVTEVGKKLQKYHDDFLQKIILTSSGQLIGLYVKDLATGSRTQINWD